MLNMTNISKVYQTEKVQTHALRDFNLQVKEGEFIAVTGPSGSGKTTIVHHLLEVKKEDLDFSVSATSREKRGAEIDGKDYHFHHYFFLEQDLLTFFMFVKKEPEQNQ